MGQVVVLTVEEVVSSVAAAILVGVLFGYFLGWVTENTPEDKIPMRIAIGIWTAIIMTYYGHVWWW